MAAALLARSSLQAARAAAPRQAFVQQARNVHFENKVYDTLPLVKGGPKHKLGVALKLGAFFGTAASLPIIAITYQKLK